MEQPELSVVIPVHNEAESLRELHASLRREIGPAGEILFVDDGSTDGTAETLRALGESDPGLRVLRLRRRYGKSQALAVAFRRARGRLIATLDGDLQDDPAEIAALRTRLESGADVVVGWRRRRHDAAWKVFISRVFNTLVSVLCGVRLHDINCGQKLFRREVLEGMVLAGGFHRFLPILAHWRGYRVDELEVAHRARAHGRSRYGPMRVFRALMDLVVILFLVRFEARPGRLFVGLGGVQLALGVLVSAYIAWLRLATGSVQSRYPLMALGLVLIVVGFQCLTLGLFGELLAYHFRGQRPVEPVVDEEGA